MRILFLTNIPSPYRVKFFNELGTKCDLTVLFEKKTSEERHDSWKHYDAVSFRSVELGGVSTGVDSAFAVSVLRYLSDPYEYIFVSNATTPTGMLAILYLRSHRVPFIIEGDGGFAKSGKGLLERWKYYLISSAQWWFSTSSKHDHYYLTYGADEAKIIRYPFSSIDSQQILNVPPTKDKKAKLRNQLGLPEGNLIISVGRFVAGKGFSTLLKSFSMLHAKCSLLMVGGTLTPEYQDIIADQSIEGVIAVDFLPYEQLSLYYQAADLFVLATKQEAWGLVINEAMSNALPVITTERCIAGLEMVKPGYNGYLIPVGDEIALAEAMDTILQDQTLQISMAVHSLEIAAAYTIQTMAERHMEFMRSDENNA